jgi:hypothetical protein
VFTDVERPTQPRAHGQPQRLAELVARSRRRPGAQVTSALQQPRRHPGGEREVASERRGDGVRRPILVGQPELGQTDRQRGLAAGAPLQDAQRRQQGLLRVDSRLQDGDLRNKPIGEPLIMTRHGRCRLLEPRDRSCAISLHHLQARLDQGEHRARHRVAEQEVRPLRCPNVLGRGPDVVLLDRDPRQCHLRAGRPVAGADARLLSHAHGPRRQRLGTQHVARPAGE